jgi:hypothetical protein
MTRAQPSRFTLTNNRQSPPPGGKLFFRPWNAATRGIPIAKLSPQVERNRAGCAMDSHLKGMSERADVSLKGRLRRAGRLSAQAGSPDEKALGLNRNGDTGRNPSGSGEVLLGALQQPPLHCKRASAGRRAPFMVVHLTQSRVAARCKGRRPPGRAGTPVASLSITDLDSMSERRQAQLVTPSRILCLAAYFLAHSGG